MNRVRVSLLVAVAVCVATLVASADAATAVRSTAPLHRFSAKQAFVAGHLYVGGDAFYQQTQGYTDRLVRYPMTNGQAASKPDLVFGRRLVGPVAVDSSGNVYSAVLCGSNNFPGVAVFPPNSTKATRSVLINFPQVICNNVYYYLIIKGLAVDPSGYLYVSLDVQCTSCIQTQMGPLQDCGTTGNTCTVVYKPGAIGMARPVAVINPGTYTLGMAFDSSGNLFMEQATKDYDATAVQVWANPHSSPTLIGTMQGSSFVGTAGLAIDSSGNLYVGDSQVIGPQHTRKNSYVAVFPDNVFGNVTPTRVIQDANPQTWWYGIAIDDKYLYTGNGLTASSAKAYLETYDKNANGHVAPLWTQQISGVPQIPEYLAVGP